MSQRTLIPADDVRALRAALRLKQAELAERLGVTRRTVIRGEQRGLEIPYRFGNSPRKAVGEAWRALKAEAAKTLEKRAAELRAAARRRANKVAARRYRARKRVTVPPRSRATLRRARGGKAAASTRGRKIRRRDTSRKIPAKKSPRRAGRRRVRK